MKTAWFWFRVLASGAFLGGALSLLGYGIRSWQFYAILIGMRLFVYLEIGARDERDRAKQREFYANKLRFRL